MFKTQYGRLLLLGAALVVFAGLPAHAEFVWNPFEHMTNEEAGETYLLVLFVMFFGLVGFPALIGFVTYAVLRRKYPEVPAKLKTVLLYTFAGYLVANLVGKLLPSPPWPDSLNILLLCLGVVISIGFTVGGAALGFFKSINQG
ncbi:hypothetical protein [Hymenobacter negativus]|uniref:Uncharacterized protein n=1 Tax=Hymenobacter negativus TaxID=2795026 RepID=A0ABS3QJ08_9BACT|nr:hypothetical protein [Hymenobacter negativus]MBO2011013.1 hypothetical protein [Hymenobacter negativus]